MKLVVQIPCYNEEKTLPLVLASIPKKIKGVDQIEILVIDDGCTDKTIEVAKSLGVKHFVIRTHRGLARSFHDGLMKSLEMGADIIVNTDGDNQYKQERIGDLIKPILDGQADIVLADRLVQSIDHFSKGKKIMQAVGTKILNAAAGVTVPDAPSGFRAYSREAALQLNVVTRFSYAMETLIQAGNKGLVIASVPIPTNPKTRESRLFKSSWEHIFKSGTAITRAFIMYRPYVIFNTAGITLFVLGLIPFVRYLILWSVERHAGAHLQSLLVGSVLIIAAVIVGTVGIVADLTRINRALNEEMLEQQKRIRFKR